MGVNLHDVLAPNKTPADRARRRRALVARAATRRKTSAEARRAHAAKPPEGARMAYTAGLGRLIKETWGVILTEVAGVIAEITVKQDDLRGARPFAVADKIRVKLYEIVDRKAPGLVDATGKAVSKHNATEMKRVVGIDPRVDFGTANQLDQFRKNNVALIKSIADDQLDRVGEVLGTNYGLRVEDLAELLEDEFSATKSRANLIARDQTSRLNGQLTKTRQESAGIDEYIWSCSQDERVRETHLANEGKRFRWDTPPPITGHPSDDIQCRCTAFPLIPELDGAED